METIPGGQVTVDELQTLNFEDAAKGWIDDRFGRNEITEKMHYEYALNIQTLKRWFARKKIGEITWQKLRDFQTERAKEKKKRKPTELVGPNTINKECNLICQLREAIGMPYEDGQYKPLRNPYRQNKKGKVMSEEQELRLMHLAKTNPNWEAAYLFMLISKNTSAGPAEVRGIQFFDILLKHETGPCVHIRGTKARGRDRLEPLNKQALEGIILAMDRVKRLAKEAGAPVREDSYLFPLQLRNKKHDPSQPQTTFRTAWEKLRKCAGLSDYRQYDLRHHCATALLTDPENSHETIKDIVGHIPDETLKFYSHIRIQNRRQALDRMLRKKVKKYERKPAQSTGVDPELVAQIASAVTITLAQLQKEK